MKTTSPSNRQTARFRAPSILLVGLFFVGAVAFLGGCGDKTFKDIVSDRTALVSYDACSDLEADLKEMLQGELESAYLQADSQRGLFGWVDENLTDGGRGDVALAADGAAAPPSAPREEGVDFSGTNNQETGVDEADIAKTDGYNFYVLNGREMHIFGVPEFGDLVPLSSIEVEGYPSAMLMRSDRAIVFSTVYVEMLPEEHPMREHLLSRETSDNWWRVRSATKVTVIDITDREAPEVVREIFMEGWYQTARRIEDSILMGVYGLLDVPVQWWFSGTRQDMYRQYQERREVIESLELSQLIPQIYERTSDDGYHAHSLTQAACSSFHRPTHSSGRGVASILSLDLFGAELELKADHVVSNYPIFYASTDRFYIAESARDFWWFWFNRDHPDQTNIHAFDILGPGETSYRGSGRVRGRALNQFSLGEHDGHLRIATTEQRDRRWWEEGALPTENHVFVLSLETDGDHLPTAGHVGGLAEGERVFSARFVGDKGYVVTFVDIDPLFTIDLSDPTNPTVIAELKIPGFSTYIHPIEDGRLLTMGVGGDDFGANWRAQVSMFDVSDFADPKLQDAHELVTEGEWGWTEAMHEHKAFTYWAPRKLLAVPVSSYNRTWVNNREEYTWYARLELINVDTSEGLSSYGTIDHSDLFNRDQDEPRFWYYRDVRRSYFMGDFIYSVSDAGVMVHTIEGLTAVASEPLQGYVPHYYDWWR